MTNPTPTNPPATVSPFHFLHRWTQWSEPVTVEYEQAAFTSHSTSYATWTVIPADSPAVIVGYREQYRHCSVCAHAEMRRV